MCMIYVESCGVCGVCVVCKGCGMLYVVVVGWFGGCGT